MQYCPSYVYQGQYAGQMDTFTMNIGVHIEQQQFGKECDLDRSKT